MGHKTGVPYPVMSRIAFGIHGAGGLIGPELFRLTSPPSSSPDASASTSAVTGAIHTPSMSPHLPVTPTEIAEAALGAAEAGAEALRVAQDNLGVARPVASTVLPLGAAIGKDGTVSALTPGDPPTAVVTVDQLKLVNPDPQTMTRGDDGLFRTADGNAADADPAVTLAPASLEGSNVNPVAAMVSMITNARQFQMQTKLLENADKNDQSANQLLSFS